MRVSTSFKKLMIISTGMLVCSAAVYAADTLIQNLRGWQTADTPGSYGTRLMTVNKASGSWAMSLINKDGDTNTAGDYFSWYYYDPAFGMFEVDPTSSERVRLTWDTTNSCAPTHDGYKLEGFSYNPDFGFMNFNYDSTRYTYICLPKDPTDDRLTAKLGWHAYSPYIGFQSLDGIEIDTSVDFSADHDAEGRYIKVDGVVASGNSEEALAGQFDDDVRVLGELTKSTFRKDIHQKIFSVVTNVTVDNGSTPYTATNLWNAKWNAAADGKTLVDDSVLYFGNVSGETVTINGNNNIEGNKTLVVEGGNIRITGDIRNTDGDGILWIIALEKDGDGWNIYIEPSVTDIHAIMYADRSLISYKWANAVGARELDGSTPASELANQLYIQGSVFSENTIGASTKLTPECPYYVEDSACNPDSSVKYDLNFLRRYILVQPVDGDGNPDGPKIPQYGGSESYMNTTSRGPKPDNQKYPVIIEYDSKVQQTPPPFFN